MSGTSTEKIEHAVELLSIRMTSMRSALVGTSICCILAITYATVSLAMNLIQSDKINEMKFNSCMLEFDVQNLKYRLDEAENKLVKILSPDTEIIPKTSEVDYDDDVRPNLTD